MKIRREVNGRLMEFELTSHELADAYEEYRRNSDIADIMCVADYHVDDAEFEEEYGITVEKLEEIAPECARRYRHYMDDDGRWFDNAVEAIRDIIILKKLDKSVKE